MTRPPRVLCIVLAGGKGSRLGPLTEGRAKPSLPVGGHYRLIDISLSNAAHSGLTEVWVLQQYEPHLLNEHLANGRPWDLDRTRGGFRILPPFQGEGQDGFAGGNADALAENWSIIEAAEPDVVLVCSADHLFRFDYRGAVEAHVDGGVDATLVTTTLPPGEDASRYMLVHTDGDRVRDVAYKPDSPDGRQVSTEVFLYQPKALGNHLRELSRSGENLGDYGERLLPRMIEAGSVSSVDHDGYWRDLGTPAAYLAGNLDLLADRPKMRMDDPSWAMLTSMPSRAPARVNGQAKLDRAWLSPGSRVAGTVVNSVIGPGAVVERGAEVRHSVLMGDVTVRSGASVAKSVLSEGVTVGRGAHVGSPRATNPVLIGAHRRIAADAEVPTGTHLPPTAPHGLLRPREADSSAGG
ncbi:glucose-1-phosphate adenylyltransferase family protein [Actinophytocola oryzae]|uniref:Glucose-1-phosphate adenylyltransferase n=1 Tax=Actinophytocola oryzae TaxID=502181 RepID=A0A4R7V629_9PSEU|nr:sugar phosphate nucleotidyltransferase [Actinophytocola oryzae]TDV44274.1 glucose-1-phosphate adenylyltransferase [Actinophytocola oryzae]